MAKKLAFDKVLFTAILLLVGLGLIMVYSASAALARDRGTAVNPFLVKQIAAAAIGFVAMWIGMHLDLRKLRRPAVVYGLLTAICGLLVLVLFANKLNSVNRWLFVAGVSVQPSEFAKLIIILYLAYQLDKKPDEVNRVAVLLPCGLVTLFVAGLVLLQPDMGTAVMLVASAGLLLFLGGLAWRFVVGLAALALPVAVSLMFSASYRRERLLSFLNPEGDPLGSGFQALQSLIAVGSGGAFGLGPGQSVQKLYFLPYPHSDFIFAIIAEELGMLGALAVVALFCVVLWRGVRAGWRAPDLFTRYLAWGVAGVLVLQAFFNVSVAIALVPTKGIPLPFLSYGGSSMVASLAASGLLLNVSQHG